MTTNNLVTDEKRKIRIVRCYIVLRRVIRSTGTTETMSRLVQYDIYTCVILLDRKKTLLVVNRTRVCGVVDGRPGGRGPSLSDDERRRKLKTNEEKLEFVMSSFFTFILSRTFTDQPRRAETVSRVYCTRVYLVSGSFSKS